jgi:hypothetical protein
MILLILVPSSRLLNDVRLPLLSTVFLPFSRHHSILYLLVSLELHLFLPLLVYAQQVESIRNQVFLNVPIERCICREAGSIVDFEEVRIELMVDHNIEA